MQGQVTVAPGMFAGNTFAIQDDTGGIYVYAGTYALPTMALGDTGLVTGTLKLYNGLLEVDPVTGIVNLGAGTVPDPTPATTGNVDPTQGLLIEVSGTATWPTTSPAPGTANWTFTINDGSGQVAVFVDKDTQIDMRKPYQPGGNDRSRLQRQLQCPADHAPHAIRYCGGSRADLHHRQIRPRLGGGKRRLHLHPRRHQRDRCRALQRRHHR